MGSGYRRTPVDIHKGYLDMPSTPLFAFGHGLSDTTFDYSPLKLTSDTVDVSGEARVSLTVTNTGKRRGTEVVQLYAADTATGVTLPAQQLVGFIQLGLDPGALRPSFRIPRSRSRLSPKAMRRRRPPSKPSVDGNLIAAGWPPPRLWSAPSATAGPISTSRSRARTNRRQRLSLSAVAWVRSTRLAVHGRTPGRESLHNRVCLLAGSS